MQDVVERIWDFIDDFNINSVLKFLKDNIVGTVVVVSLIFWVPISCLISYVDNKRAKKVTFYVKSIWANFRSYFDEFFSFQDEEEWEWRTRDELIHPSDRRRIIHVRVPRRSSGQNGHTSCENAYAGGASRLIRTTPTQSAL